MNPLRVSYKKSKSSKKTMEEDALALSKILVAKWERKDEQRVKKLYGIKK